MKAKLAFRYSVTFTLTLLLLLWTGCLSRLVSPDWGEEGPSGFTVPWRSSAEADGYIKPGEYDDAVMINLTRGDSVAYLYVKHDGEFLYVFLDYVSDTIFWFDNFWVTIDTLSDGGEAPREDDYLFDSTHHIWLGDGPHKGDISGGQWEELKGHRREPYPDLADRLQPFLEGRHMGWSGQGRSANSLTPHSIFEIKIPIKGWEIKERRTFGFCAAAGSPAIKVTPSTKVVWPDTAYDYYAADFWAGGATLDDPTVIDPQIASFPPPSTWGTITLSDVPPQEKEGGSYWFYLIIGVVAVAAGATVILLLRKLKKLR